MSADVWQQLLSRCEQRDAPGTTWISPLPDYAILDIEGPDAARFLQGQLTCHLDAITTERGASGAQCSLKGRVLASFLLAQVEPQRYWLRLRRDLLGATAAALGKFVVFSKAKLTPLPDLIVLGAAGDAARGLLPAAATPAGARHATFAVPGGIAWQRDDAGHRLEFWLTGAEALALAERATETGIALVEPAHWALLDVQAGEVDVRAASSDRFLPQMLNYDMTGAVRFDKGCYTGQEVVARAHYRGQVKRRLGRYTLTGEAPLPATPVLDAAGREVGEVVEAASAAPGQCELLAVVTESAAPPLRIGTHDLRALSLPYAISDANR